MTQRIACRASRGPPILTLTSRDQNKLSDSINLISFKILKSDMGYPINVFGNVLVRDQKDTLTLTDPLRGLAITNGMFFEVNLKASRRYGSGDTEFSKANLAVNILEGPRDFFTGEVVAWTSGNKNRIILYDSRVEGTETSIGDGGRVVLSRCLVAVPVKKNCGFVFEFEKVVVKLNVAPLLLLSARSRMFYSHQLLARKAPLGQIWMAATLHSKINRKRLDKLDIIQICEEILNPSVPMALRLSGILMGGVVIVYERKVKLLYDDVSRLLIDINEAWRIKPAKDPTVLPKGKAQAKYEAVTLPEKIMNMEVEQPMTFSEVDAARFRGMRLDELDEQYVNVNLDDDDFSRAEHPHQAEAVNITLVDNFESGLAETDLFNRFERFDIADDETTVNVTPDEHPQVPSTLVPSPPRQEDPPQQEEQYHAAPSPVQEEPQRGGSLEEQEEQKMKKQQPPKASKRKACRKLPQVIMDNNQIMIPGNIYQTWLKDTSSLVSKRRKVNSSFNFIRSTKISDLMDMPPVALISYSDKSSSELYYPKPLMQLWKECTEVNSATASSGEYEMETGAHLMDFTDGIEKLRGNMSAEYDRAYDTLHSDHSATPGTPGLSRRSASSSGGSGRGFIPLDPEIQIPSGSGRSKRRQHSSGRSLGNLDPVKEDFPLEQEVRDFKMRRLSDFAPTPDLMEETEPTQTPYEKRSGPIDKVTESIQSHLKLHFDTPGVLQSESLGQLASGMTTARAARLFYQMTVLATFDYIKVAQEEPYGDILISRGAKM
ncbi:Sister chromatid cohesion 1 protein 1 [Dichanthelium oligosanthes]|uniref:Sister chromatid cohesion 1 protein 1 n=1 Tax=Dichanthelium oligosanthes TaxID=888268 RepID=A0A1E5UXI5_9POAL|nr:Sister chromatid cohesion 1 protein 1 [Dichanthelium oligosanthes]